MRPRTRSRRADPAAGLLQQRHHQHRHQQDRGRRSSTLGTFSRTIASSYARPRRRAQSPRHAACCSTRPASRCGPPPCRTPNPARGSCDSSGLGLRRVPTDLHLRDGEIEAPKLPIILGHQIVGTTDDGRRVGVPWLGWTDGECRYCTSGRENLCVDARFTGRDIDGGFARVHRGRRALLLRAARRVSATPGRPAAVRRPDRLPGAAPGRRRATGSASTGSARRRTDLPGRRAPGPRGLRLHPRRRRAHPGFARSLGAIWAGGSDEPPPEQLDAAIIFASAGALVPAALRALAPGGTVVCAGIHMSDIPCFPYEDLWHERTIRSVANLTRERRPGVPGARAARCRSTPPSPSTRSATPSRRWRTSAPAASPAPPCSCRAPDALLRRRCAPAAAGARRRCHHD